MKLVRLSLLALLLGVLIPRPGAAAVSFDPRAGLASPEDSLPPPGVLPGVTRIYTEPAQPNTETPTSLVLLGRFPYRCGAIVRSQVIDPSHVTFAIQLRAFCQDSVMSWKQAFDLGLLPAGPHRVWIDMFVGSDSIATQETHYQGIAEFVVTGQDTNPPPPQPEPLPYVTSIRIAPKPNLLPVERPICADDSILVMFSGTFPSDCYVLKGVQVLYYPSFAVGPPVVRVVIDNQSCVGRLCLRQTIPWSASALLGPLPSGNYSLIAQLGVTSCSDSIPPDSLFSTGVPFGVVDSCGAVPPPPQACLLGSFLHPNGPLQCDASISGPEPVELAFGVNSGVALAGLQGRFAVYPPALRITKLEPIGPASGMHVNWTPTADGVRFVMFSEQDAPIPPSPWPANAVIPVLQVTLRAPANTPIPDLTRVHGVELLGSDENGGGVPECDYPNYRFADVFSGRICLERLCDHNGDGVLDVRDLVQMVRCLNGEGPCRDSSGAIYDCNQDSVFTIDDILCCAGRLLAQAACPDCSLDTSGTRREPRVSLLLGPPVPTGGGADLPLTLEGADRIGAARLSLSYPSDRYDVTSVEFPGSPANWLDLYHVSDGEIAIGLIQMAAGGTADLESRDIVVHLALKPGSTPGGQVQATGGDFSGPDGVKLEVSMGAPAQPLGGPARLALSASRPNPFSSETRFTLTLDRPASVDLAIYDIGGRRVASLFSGALPAGSRDFSWNGRDLGGTPVASGIYFYRATAGGQKLSRKLILLRGN